MKSYAGQVESVILLAFLMAMAALSIDAILPALKAIGTDFGLPSDGENSLQLTISFLFVGLAGGQIFFGPLSDSIGRKKAVYIGLLIFLFGCFQATFATNFVILLIGRVIQGIGIASARVNAVAIIRDRFKGKEMARVMSWILTIFIFVPMVAPAIGQLTLEFLSWRWIFVMMFLSGGWMLIWFALRLPETLSPEHVRPFRVSIIISGVKETLCHPVACSYLLCAGLVSGGFFGFLNCSQQLFSDLYGITRWFAACFAFVAFFVAVASVCNGFLVRRFSVQKLTIASGVGMAGSALLTLGVALFTKGIPPFLLTMVYFSFTFFCAGVLFSNLNALAMEPLGHMAGVGSAAVGSISTAIATTIGWMIGSAFNGTIIPLLVGIAAVNLLSLPLMLFAEKKRHFMEN